MSTPSGVTVLVTDKNGKQVGVGSDFVAQAPRAGSLREVQEGRARIEAWWRAMHESCGRPELARAIRQDDVVRDRLRQRLTEQSGWREHVIVHGHGEEGD